MVAQLQAQANIFQRNPVAVRPAGNFNMVHILILVIIYRKSA